MFRLDLNEKENEATTMHLQGTRHSETRNDIIINEMLPFTIISILIPTLTIFISGFLEPDLCSPLLQDSRHVLFLSPQPV